MKCAPIKLVATALGVASTSAIALDVQPRIIGGCTSQTDRYPYTVALASTVGNPEFGAQFCGATLIHANWVLTAAHCLFVDEFGGSMVPIAPTDVQVLLDAETLSTSEIASGIQISEIITHPSYNPEEPTSQFDIALLKLAVPQNREVARLATVKPGGSLTALVLGWGDTNIDDDIFAPSQTLQEVNVQTFSDAACDLALPSVTIAANQLCAGTVLGGQDSCQGDSGSPLFLNTPNGVTQVGIVSFGDGCARPDTPGVYTSVDSYLEWIENNTIDSSTGISDIPAPTGVGEVFGDLFSICVSGPVGVDNIEDTSSISLSGGGSGGGSGHAAAPTGAVSIWTLLIGLIARVRSRSRCPSLCHIAASCIPSARKTKA